MIRWVWSMIMQPVATLRLAIAGGVPVPELVTLAVVVSSIYSASLVGAREGNLVLALYAAIAAVVLSLVGIWFQVSLVWGMARLLGWHAGTWDQIFRGYGPVLALNIALDLLRWGPDLFGYLGATLALDLISTAWQWSLLVVAVRFITGLRASRAILAVLPAILLWDIPWLILSLKTIRPE